MTTQLIHWTNLAASPRNVRKIKTGIDTLAASIAADGLLHNLTVIAREDGKYEVIAGVRKEAKRGEAGRTTSFRDLLAWRAVPASRQRSSTFAVSLSFPYVRHSIITGPLR